MKQFKINAEIIFPAMEQGGRKTPPSSGYHPQLKLGKWYTSCVVISADPQVIEFTLGVKYQVYLEFLLEESLLKRHGEDFVNLINRLSDFKMYEGARKVAEGKVISINRRNHAG